MVNLLIGGIIASMIVISIGVLYALPPYIKAYESSHEVPSILLSISITSSQSMPDWCQDIAELVNNNNLKAVVFFSGRAAEEDPDCVKRFNSNVDIGSSTYSYVKLSAERDYLDQLEDVRKGKAILDSIAGINSTSFKAPDGYTDENIYSLLSRNGILADFSHEGSYNLFENDKFIFHELITVNLSETSQDEIESQLRQKVADQMQITIDNSVSVEKATSLILSIIKNNEATFVNASDLAGRNLTARLG